MVGDSYTVTYPAAGGNEDIVYVSVQPVSGQPCPTCGRRVPLTGAQRQRRWRERRKLLVSIFGEDHDGDRTPNEASKVGDGGSGQAGDELTVT